MKKIGKKAKYNSKTKKPLKNIWSHMCPHAFLK